MPGGYLYGIFGSISGFSLALSIRYHSNSFEVPYYDYIRNRNAFYRTEVRISNTISGLEYEFLKKNYTVCGNLSYLHLSHALGLDFGDSPINYSTIDRHGFAASVSYRYLAAVNYRIGMALDYAYTSFHQTLSLSPKMGIYLGGGFMSIIICSYEIMESSFQTGIGISYNYKKLNKI
jgi:hypothetical protein